MQLDLFALLQIPEQYTAMLQRYAAAMILLAVLILITKWQGIGIGSKLIVGTIRGTIQIILMALILVYIFALSDLFVIFGVLT
jgi:ABC-type iron transport system FetAB permease component